MNLIAAMLLSLWVAGWVAAMVRAGLKARGAALAEASVNK